MSRVQASMARGAVPTGGARVPAGVHGIGVQGVAVWTIMRHPACRDWLAADLRHLHLLDLVGILKFTTLSLHQFTNG